MFEPNSTGLVVVLAVLAVGLLVLAVRAGRRWIRALLSVALVAAGLFGGFVVVNDYYGYYQTWTQLADDFGGGVTPHAVTAAHGDQALGSGDVRLVEVHGAASNITRPAYVYLPPQYFQRRFAHTRFPVIELFHGSPGGPANWVEQLRIADVMKSLMTHHAIGPTVLVMPTDNKGNQADECLDSALGADETYLTTDLRRVMEHRFRVSRDPQEWGAGGFSSGGYCAANLALRHPNLYGAAFSLDGYFDPNDGPAANVLDHDPAAMAANDPLELAAHTTWGQTVPAFWLATGTEGGDYKQSAAMVRALQGVERVPFVVEHGGRHNFYAWAAAMPSALSWAWQQISPPGLRHRFPQAGVARQVRISPLAPPSGSSSTR